MNFHGFWKAIRPSLILGMACVDVGPAPFTEAQPLGGRLVSVEVLTQGRRAYERYCQSCHGPQGDGQGPLGIHQRPRARDLRLGIIKFGGVAAGSLPTDQDLRRIIRRGIRGTAMLPWNVPDAELDAVVQYIKTFSPRWRTELAGRAISISEDPWGAKNAASAVRSGEKIYHGLAGCFQCHPAYLSPRGIRDLAIDADPKFELPVREDLYTAIRVDSAFGPILATDFRAGLLRGGSRPEDIYRSIAAGIGGTAMPSWKGQLEERDLWALVYYLRSLPGRAKAEP